MALKATAATTGLHEADQTITFQGRGFTEVMAQAAYVHNAVLGDFAKIAEEGDCTICPLAQQNVTKAEFAARIHDVATSRALLAQAASFAATGSDFRAPRGSYPARSRYFLNAMLEDWPAALADARAYEGQVRAEQAMIPGMLAVRLRLQVPLLLAQALARSGDAAGAEAAIRPTPGDCYDCVRTRGLVAAAAKQWGRADYWFARAVHDQPSIPGAYADWGQSLLERGQTNAAIEKFALSNKYGSHFADALQGWGEALMSPDDPIASGAGEIRGSRKICPQLGQAAAEMG